MMTDHKTNQIFWAAALYKLQFVIDESPSTDEEIDHFYESFPIRNDHESISDWLKRGRKGLEESAVILPFPRCRFRKQDEIIRLAAVSLPEEKPPLPEHPLEPEDGRYRLLVSKQGGQLELRLEAIGLAIDDFANQYISITKDEDMENILAVIKLNQYGDGQTLVQDTILNRKILLKPTISIIDADDA